MTYTIEVFAVGNNAKEALSLYTVFLHGPGDFRHTSDTGRFDSMGICRFTNLPMGTYWVTADTKADVGWSVTPSRAEVRVGDADPLIPAMVRIKFGGGSDSGPGISVRDHRRR
jgi:hypothetical protein